MTDRYAVIGQPVSHSRSPQIHSHFAALTGQPMEYGRIEASAAEFADRVREFFGSGGCGLNVTLPHKEAAARLADSLSERAQVAGAVNVLCKQVDGSLLGDNTDGAGLLADLGRLGVPITRRRVLVLGAGGATRGIIGPLLALQPSLLTIGNRTVLRAQQLVTELQALLPESSTGILEVGQTGAVALQPFDLLINATSSGHTQQAPLIAEGAIGTQSFAYDLSYGPAAQPFLALTRSRGAGGGADGLGMLIEQAAESFWVWRGLRPDTRALHEQLQSSSVPSPLNKP